MPSIWFLWKISDFLVARGQKLGTRGHWALLEHSPALIRIVFDKKAQVLVLVLQSWEVLNLPFYTPKIMRLCCFTKWPLKLQVLICTYCHSYCRYKRRLILSESQDNNTLKHTKPVMVDDHKLIQRQKQIDIGKNTLSYGRYIEAVKRYWFDNTQLTSTLIDTWAWCWESAKLS